MSKISIKLQSNKDIAIVLKDDELIIEDRIQVTKISDELLNQIKIGTISNEGIN